MAESVQSQPAGAHAEEGTRRDFLVIAANALMGVGAACVAWPLIKSMNPAQDVLAAGAPVDIDISSVQPGQQIVVLWRSRPIFIVRRPPDMLTKLQSDADHSLLRDPDSEVVQQPPYAKNQYRSVKPDVLVLVGICTHLGCIPNFVPAAGGSLGDNWPGGYFCPCHGSRYDLAGRVFSGVPAPYNLPVPPYHFVSDTVVRIGENPPDSTFDFASIEQI
ncbi:MAG TPA: ubiquinol-cytochrome c reductase iron-sulfur subunit [Stellaceae bacterium]|nr:ubiquinol-cytochrome c reductase iron-sulfur subunit [Stellaceae bacterium]